MKNYRRRDVNTDATMRRSTFRLCFFIVLIGFAVPAASISDPAGSSQSNPSGRSLLQATKSCPVNFEFMNYSMILNNCKGPKYPPASCCSAFKQFACPYVDEINDLTNDCATTMFSYINLYGKYPPGLFALECREGKQGLACNQTLVTKVGAGDVSGHRQSTSHASFFLFFSAILCLAFHFILPR